MDQHLSALQKNWRRHLLAQMLLIIGGSAALATAGATLLAHFGQTQWGLRAALTGVLLTLLGLVWKHRAPFRPLERSRHQIALLSEKLAPEAGSSPTSAVNFLYTTRSSAHVSKGLINEHILQTETLLRTFNFQPRLRQHFAPTRTRIYRFGLLSLGLCLALAAGLNRGRQRLLHAFLNPNAVEISATPLAGDIQLTFRYPAYTKQSPQVIEGGNGSIRALHGTEVELKATAGFGVTSASLIQFFSEGVPQRTIPVTVTDHKKLQARFTVLENSRYSFSLLTEDGAKMQEQKRHPIIALPDHSPEITMDSPAGDIELRESESVPVLWHARDDYGVATVTLVIEPDSIPGAKQPPEVRRIKLARADKSDRRREGRYSWKLSQLALAPGQGAGFYLEAIDTDTINGPKRTVSPTYRLNIFSVQKHHEEVLLMQTRVLDALVDWLGLELTNLLPASSSPLATTHHENQTRVLTHVQTIRKLTEELTERINEDELSRDGVITAFHTVLTHVQQAINGRTPLLKRLKKNNQNTQAYNALRSLQRRDIKQLEKDIIYLDDLLAIQRIEELKATANDLLSAQRELRGLLETYRQTQDPTLKNALQNQIRELRNQMLDLLQKMSKIKQQLPGEYQNMEAGKMNKIDDQLARLENMLQTDDLEGAAQELEQLANMIEQMMDSIDKAESEYGGERYDKIREQLAEFSQSFEEIEEQQKALSKRTNELLKEYREKSIEEVGDDIEKFIKRIRKLAGEAIVVLEPFAVLSPPAPDPHRHLDKVRQRLFDLDALLQERDFSEGRQMAGLALKNTTSFQQELKPHLKRFRPPARPPLHSAASSLETSRKAQLTIVEELDKLFPAPEEVLEKEQIEQMKRMAQKQSELQQQTAELGGKMQELAQEVPLFGQESQGNLQSARSQMGRAQSELSSAKLPNAASSERRALEQLGKLREALQKASESSGDGFPMPLGSSSPPGSKPGSKGRGLSQKNVDIPELGSGKGDPRFRKELLNAAKQRAPQRYEDAVRKYYEELIK